MKCFYCEKGGTCCKFCPLILKLKEKEKGKMHHAHAAKDDEPLKKIAREDDSSDDDYIIISAVTGPITHGNDTWLVDSSAYKYMIGYKGYLSNLIHKDSPHNV